MNFVVRGLLVMALAVIPRYALSQSAADYPSKPVRVIVTSTAGGPSDLLTRLLSTALEKQFKQSFVVEDRPGGLQAIGLQAVTQAPADGYTLGVATSGFPYEEVTNKDWSLRFARDFTAVSLFASGGTAIIVPANLPVTNMQELVAYAKRNPGKLNQATTGSAPPPQITAMWQKLGINDLLTLVPYKGGGDAAQSVAKGESDIWTATVLDAITFEKAGRVKILAYTEQQRYPTLPSVPTLGEAHPSLVGHEYSYWFALLGPAGLPDSIVEKLYTGVRGATGEAQFRTKINDLGMQTNARTPEQSRNRINAELQSLRDMAAAGIKLR